MAKHGSSTPSLPDNYQAESDVRTMMDYHKIKGDAKRHKAAVAHMKTQIAAMKVETGEMKKD